MNMGKIDRALVALAVLLTAFELYRNKIIYEAASPELLRNPYFWGPAFFYVAAPVFAGLCWKYPRAGFVAYGLLLLGYGVLNCAPWDDTDNPLFRVGVLNFIKDNAIPMAAALPLGLAFISRSKDARPAALTQ